MGPVSVDVMLSLIFRYCPATSPNTLIENVQFAPAESVPPLRSNRDVPAVAVTVSPVRDPIVQILVKPLGVPINKPVGRLSEKPIPVKAEAFGLLIVKVNVLLVPCGIDEGEKALESSGGSARGQPLTTTLSSHISAAGVLFFLE